MSSFFTDLVSSIFTPGPTPTLLIATNATFGALQILLISLLIATRSIHFAILSTLCGALWWAINWFAGELRAAQEKEEEAKRIRGARRSREKEALGAGDGVKGGVPGSEGEGMDSGDDTETEVEDKPVNVGSISSNRSGGVSKYADTDAQAVGLQQSGVPSATTQTRLAPSRDGLKNRRSMAESDASLSTDSEWEKVDEEQ